MIKVFIAKNPTEAHLVQGLLRNKGIPAEVRGESLFSVEGAAAIPDMRPAVWVPAEQDQMRLVEEVLAQYQGLPTAVEGPPWTCPGCGEVNEPQFTDCWKCGSAQT